MNSEKVLSFFKEITKIPRESGHEEQIIAFLQKFAAHFKQFNDLIVDLPELPRAAAAETGRIKRDPAVTVAATQFTLAEFIHIVNDPADAVGYIVIHTLIDPAPFHHGIALV